MSAVALKVELKEWEKTFTVEYRRKPTKNDIRSRKEIYAKYMQYNKLQKQEARDPLKDASNRTLPRPGHVKEFKFNPEDQSTLSPPPVSPPQTPTCEESFLVGYFTLDAADTAPSSARETRHRAQTSSRRFQLDDLKPAPALAPQVDDEEFTTEDLRAIQDLADVTESEESVQEPDMTEHLGELNVVPANYFLFKSSNSFGGMNTSQMNEIRQQLAAKEPDTAASEQPTTGMKRQVTDIGCIGNGSPVAEPQRKRRKIQKAETMPATTTSFQWGSTAAPSVASTSNAATYNGSGKRENFVRLNLRKGKRNAGGRRGRGVKGSSKAMRVATTQRELQADDSSTVLEEDYMMEETTLDDPAAVLVPMEEGDDDEILIDLSEDSSEPEVPVMDAAAEADLDRQLLESLKTNFGYDSFRFGQGEAVRRIVQQQSTLVCIPTGSGKSLIYQLPALFAPAGSLVLVISPLLSLMSDQLKQLPPCLTGATINSSQSRKQIENVYHAIKRGRVKILFISPEKLMSHEFQRRIDPNSPDGFGVKIHFACIDEAHCISQWSHNFRPSYLRISTILKTKLQVSCILALSATCTTATRTSIRDILNIKPENVILRSPVRENLALSVSSDRDKYTALLQLLQSPQYTDLSSIIIYCMFQQDTEHLASFLQSKQFDALPYHAGKSYSDRKSVQNLFMSNKLRIVVATVAFGMGVDKSDVRAVIHFSMPRSVEAYVQEVGRAGRDGLPALGHLFLDREDFIRSHKLSFADHIDRTSIKRLLLRLFTRPADLGAAGTKDAARLEAYYVSLPPQDISEEYDVKKEVLDTLLTYLQLPSSAVGHCFRLLPPTSCQCVVQFLSSEPTVLARKYQLVQAVIDHSTKSANGKWRCDLAEIANYFANSISDVREELNRLHTMEEISYEMEEMPCVLARVTAAPDASEIDQAIAELHTKMDGLQHNKVEKLFAIYRISRHASFTSVQEALRKESFNTLEQDREMDFQIERYFREEDGSYLEHSLPFPDWPILDPRQPVATTKLQYLKGDIAMMISREQEIVKSGLIGARILHGISSPKFPADRFYHHKFWGSYSHVDFFQLVILVNQTLVAFQSR